MGNGAYRRAFASLAHPLTISAVVLLLANDFIFRRLWPSWVTGKLGDAAWLVLRRSCWQPCLRGLSRRACPGRSRLSAGLRSADRLTFALIKGVPAIHAAALP